MQNEHVATGGTQSTEPTDADLLAAVDAAGAHHPAVAALVERFRSNAELLEISLEVLGEEINAL